MSDYPAEPTAGDAARDTFCELARAVVGLEADGADDRRLDARDGAALYSALVAAGETDAAARSLVRLSGCALVIRGLWRRAGLVDPRLEAPYRIGTAVSLLIDLAHEADAWRPGSAIAAGEIGVGAGDVFLIDHPEHVGIVVAAPGDDRAWTTVEGGQRTKRGAQTILLKTRHLTRHTGRAWLDGSRPLLGVIDYGALAARFLP